MGSQSNKSNLKDKANKKADELLKEKQDLESSVLIEEINKREESGNKKDKKKSKKKNDNGSKIKFELNIYVYSDLEIDKRILNSIEQYNSEIFNWDVIDELTPFNGENSKILLDICERDFKRKNFKNVIIIPISSVENFKNTIENEDKDILSYFNDLTEEQQPFFLFIDENINDFFEYKSVIQLKNSKENKNEPDYEKFNDEIIQRIIYCKREEYDYQLKLDFMILLNEKIKILKEYILKLQKKNDYFEVYLNGQIFYQFYFGSENIDISKSVNFEGELESKILNNEILNISLILYNININEFSEYYELLDIKKVEIFIYDFKKERLLNILRQKKYEDLDKRNFNVIRFKQTPKNILLKYTGYYNQLGDILFCDQINFYPGKINIAIGGYIGSGKSTLINTIFEEKRCLEGQGSSITNYISQFSLKNYPINFYDFPGFRAKKDGKDNTKLFIEEIKSKITDLKKVSEVIHCFLFCIKFEERIFDEKDEDMKEIFDSIAKLKIRTFFIITGSEKEESKKFRNFKKIVINNLTKVKAKYKEDGDKIFGEDLEKSIIPILSRDKQFHGFTAKAFGLDNIFKVLYEYFLPKKINFQKELFLDEEKLKVFIESNELLKIFESKNKLSKDLRNKIESQFDTLLMKSFLKAPKYLYSFSEESIYELMNEFMEKVFYLFNYYLNQKSNVEKLQILNRLYDFKNKMNKELLMKIENELPIKQASDDFKNRIPLAIKILFPILSPIYYIFGTPLIKIFSSKIINNLLEHMEIDNLLYETYFEELISCLNKAIDDLNEVRKNFEVIYNYEKFYDKYHDKFEAELLKILGNDNDKISENDFNEITKICDEFLKNFKGPSIESKLKNFVFSFEDFGGETKREKNKKKLQQIALILKFKFMSS